MGSYRESAFTAEHSGGGRCLLVDHRLGQLRQLLVRRPLLLQRLLKQVGDVAQAELLRQARTLP